MKILNFKIVAFFIASTCFNWSVWGRKKCDPSDLAQVLGGSSALEARLERTTPIQWDSEDFSFVEKEIRKFAQNLVLRSASQGAFETDDVVNFVLYILYNKSQIAGKKWKDIYSQIPVITRRQIYNFLKLADYRKEMGAYSKSPVGVISLNAGEGTPAELHIVSEEFRQSMEQIEARDFVQFLHPFLTPQEKHVLKGLFFEYKEGIELARELHVTNGRITHIKNRILQKAREHSPELVK